MKLMPSETHYVSKKTGRVIPFHLKRHLVATDPSDSIFYSHRDTGAGTTWVKPTSPFARTAIAELGDFARLAHNNIQEE